MRDTKRCPSCSTEKPLEEFGIDRARHDGRCAFCKACRSIKCREAYQKDPQKVIERTNAYRREHGRGDRTEERAREKQHPNYAARMRAANARDVKKHPDRARARWRLAKAVRDGRLVRPETCSLCGEKPPETRPGVSGIDFDHCYGYAPENALRGQWVCRSCHVKAERSRKAEANDR